MASWIVKIGLDSLTPLGLKRSSEAISWLVLDNGPNGDPTTSKSRTDVESTIGQLCKRITTKGIRIANAKRSSDLAQ